MTSGGRARDSRRGLVRGRLQSSAGAFAGAHIHQALADHRAKPGRHERVEDGVRAVHRLHRQHRRRAAELQFARREASGGSKREVVVRGLERPDFQIPVTSSEQWPVITRASETSVWHKVDVRLDQDPASRIAPEASIDGVRAQIGWQSPDRTTTMRPSADPDVALERPRASFIVRIRPPRRMSEPDMRQPCSSCRGARTGRSAERLDLGGQPFDAVSVAGVLRLRCPRESLVRDLIRGSSGSPACPTRGRCRQTSTSSGGILSGVAWMTRERALHERRPDG